MSENLAFENLIAAKLVQVLLEQQKTLATAESCTGGLIAAAITDIAGSSQVFDRGFVSYSNQAKHDMLGVPLERINNHGAVSDVVAQAMVEGALKHSYADIALSVTGVAGPTSSEAKPVGLVYIGIGLMHWGGVAQVYKHMFEGNRQQIREQTMQQSFKHLIENLLR